MRSIRTSLVAAATAAAVALSATPAFAENTPEGSAQSANSDTGSSQNAQGSAKNPSQPDSSATGSSKIADELKATDSQRDVWGSSKNFDDAIPFDQLTYVYVVGSVAALVGGAAAFASQTPQAQQLAEQFNIDLPRFF